MPPWDYPASDANRTPLLGSDLSMTSTSWLQPSTLVLFSFKNTSVVLEVRFRLLLDSQTLKLYFLPLLGEDSSSCHDVPSCTHSSPTHGNDFRTRRVWEATRQGGRKRIGWIRACLHLMVNRVQNWRNESMHAWNYFKTVNQEQLWCRQAPGVINLLP